MFGSFTFAEDVFAGAPEVSVVPPPVVAARSGYVGGRPRRVEPIDFGKLVHEQEEQELALLMTLWLARN